MKPKLLFLFLIFFVFFLLHSFPLSAQESDFNRTYQDYLYSFNQYQEAHQLYANDKIAYLDYQTLTAKNNVFKSTLKMLQLRDDVVRSYLTVLRRKATETDGLSDFDKQILYSKIDSEVNWHVSHRNLLASANKLEDLFAFSDQAESRYLQTQSIAYQTLGAFPAGDLTVLRGQTNEEISQFKDKIDRIKLNNDKDTTALEQWLESAENEINLSEKAQATASQKISRDLNLNLYNQALSFYNQSLQNLKDSVKLLKQMVTEVKIAD